MHRIFYSFALFSLVLNFYYHILVSQIGSNPLLDQAVDPVYLMFMITGIARFISGWPAPYFDALLILSCLCAVIWPKQRIFSLAFLVLYFVSFIVYNMLSGHHYTNIGVLIMALPFIFSSNSRFVTAFTFCRFFFCFMMFSAACWKITRGNLWHIDQANMLLVATHIEALVASKSLMATNMIKWLISHKYVTHTLWILLIFIESIFVLGFISFKWDKWLLVAYLLFFIGGFIIFNIYNLENLVFLLTLLPVLNFISRNNSPTHIKINSNHGQMTIL